MKSSLKFGCDCRSLQQFRHFYNMFNNLLRLLCKEEHVSKIDQGWLPFFARQDSIRYPLKRLWDVLQTKRHTHKAIVALVRCACDLGTVFIFNFYLPVPAVDVKGEVRGSFFKEVNADVRLWVGVWVSSSEAAAFSIVGSGTKKAFSFLAQRLQILPFRFTPVWLRFERIYSHSYVAETRAWWHQLGRAACGWDLSCVPAQYCALSCWLH